MKQETAASAAKPETELAAAVRVVEAKLATVPDGAIAIELLRKFLQGA